MTVVIKRHNWRRSVSTPTI